MIKKNKHIFTYIYILARIFKNVLLLKSSPSYPNLQKFGF